MIWSRTLDIEPAVGQKKYVCKKIALAAKKHPSGPKDFLAAIRQGYYRSLDEKYPDPVDTRRLNLSNAFEASFQEAVRELGLDYNQYNSPNLDERKNTVNTSKRFLLFVVVVVLSLVFGILLFLWQLGYLIPIDKNTIFRLSEVTELRNSPNGKFIRSPGAVPFVVTSISSEESDTGNHLGVIVVLDSEVESASSGEVIQIDITARSARNQGSPMFSAGYFTIGQGNSGWRDFKLTENFLDYSFKYDVPDTNGIPGNDIIGIRADPLNKYRSIVIKNIKITLVSK